MCVTVPVFCCMFVCVSVCVGQGSRHAAVCRSAVPVHGRAADDATAADGGGPKVVGTGRKAAGNTHIGEKIQSGTHTNIKAVNFKCPLFAMATILSRVIYCQLCLYFWKSRFATKEALYLILCLLCHGCFFGVC